MKESTYPLQRLFDRKFLRIDEASDGDRDREVDVVSPDVLPKMHLRAGLCHSNHALQVTNRDRERTGAQRLTSELSEEPPEFVLIYLRQLRPHFLSGVHDVLS